MRLGEWLVAEGKISIEQLEAALRGQVEHGGRVGTNLVERGAIDLDELARALAARAGVPPALQHHFEHADPAAIQLVPSKLAGKHSAVPLGFTRATPRRLAVAFIDPWRPHAAEEIEHVAGHHVLASVAPELRIFYHLERLYLIPRHNRYVRVESAAARLREDHERRRFIEAFPTVGLASESPPPEVAPAIAPPNAAAAPAPRPPAAIVDVPLPPPPVRRLRPALTASDAEAAIASAADRDAIGDLVVDHLRASFGAGLVFIVRQDMALGWKGFAPNLEPAVIEGIALPLTQASMLCTAREQNVLFRGAPPADGAVLNGLLWKLLKVPAPGEIVVAPVLIGARVVNLVYAHGPGGAALSDLQVADLTAVCAAAAEAFARLIRAAKQR